MLKITFTTFCKVLNKTFTNTKIVKTMADFNLYSLALYSGQVQIISIEAA